MGLADGHELNREDDLRAAGYGTLLRECPPDWLCQSSSLISLRRAPQPTDLEDGRVFGKKHSHRRPVHRA